LIKYEGAIQIPQEAIMNRRHSTIHLHDKGKTLARTTACLLAGGLLVAACWALFGEGQSAGDMYA